MPVQPYVYSLVPGEGDTDNGSFEIVDNELFTTEAFDASVKSSYAIRVGVTDQIDEFEKPFVISVTDGPEGDVVNPIAEAAATVSNTAVFTIQFSEPVTGSPAPAVSLAGVTAVYTAGSGSDELTFTLSRPPYFGETFTIAFAQGVFTDSSGNESDAIAALAVTNSSILMDPAVVQDGVALPQGGTGTLVGGGVDLSSVIAAIEDAKDEILATTTKAAIREALAGRWTNNGTGQDYDDISIGDAP